MSEVRLVVELLSQREASGKERREGWILGVQEVTLRQ